jgi:hypothetical protein
VRQVLDADLLVAVPHEYIADERRFRSVRFRPLPDTWRDRVDPGTSVSRGVLLDYLNPDADPEQDTQIVALRGEHRNGRSSRTPLRVMESMTFLRSVFFQPFSILRRN